MKNLSGWFQLKVERLEEQEPGLWMELDSIGGAAEWGAATGGASWGGASAPRGGGPGRDTGCVMAAGRRVCVCVCVCVCVREREFVCEVSLSL